MKSTVILVFAIFLSPLLNAQVFVDPDAAGDNSGSSWENAFRDLQEAIEASNPGDEIWLRAGIYVPKGVSPQSTHFEINKSISLFGGFAGTESTLEARDWSTNRTILSGDINGDDIPGDFLQNRGDNAHHVILVNASGSKPVLDGLYIQGGTTRLDEANIQLSIIDQWRGGGMYARTSCTIRNCTFRENHGYQGAALSAFNPVSVIFSVDIIDCSFQDNLGFSTGTSWISGIRNLLISGCTFRNCESTFGGGLLLGNTNCLLRNSTFESNEALAGSGLLIAHNSASLISNASIEVFNCAFLENTSTNGEGALSVRNYFSGPQLLVDSCYFYNNTASRFGGGMGVRNIISTVQNSLSPERVTIRNSIFESNVAPFGGGLMVDNLNDSLALEISDTEFITNYATISGGGAYINNKDEAGMQVDMRNSHFTENLADRSAGGLAIDNSNNLTTFKYLIDSCSFYSNIAFESNGGAIWSFAFSSLFGPDGTIRNTDFTENGANLSGGALHTGTGTYLVEACDFNSNYTMSTAGNSYGGAIAKFDSERLRISRCNFKNNTSDSRGADISNMLGGLLSIENSLLTGDDIGNSLFNTDSISLLNVAVTGRDIGIFQQDGAYAILQNSVLLSSLANYTGEMTDTVVSRGGNVISDASLTEFLKGYQAYEDLHELDPGLDDEFRPDGPGSPCVDRGNPMGVTGPYDLAGHDRIQGGNIDIGPFESSFVSRLKTTDWQSPDLDVFPNPANHVVRTRLDFPWQGEAALYILDSFGRTVHQVAISKNSDSQVVKIPVDRLPAGQYYLIIEADRLYGSELLIQR